MPSTPTLRAIRSRAKDRDPEKFTYGDALWLRDAINASGTPGDPNPDTSTEPSPTNDN
jgi:hypothetical protein